jgi:hypothetical protein
MVSFLLDNSLGAWWAARRLTDEDLQTATSEEELREKASIPGVPLEYLRFVQDENGKWTPAAGTYEGWPEHLGELKTLDPCCGSGHFLVAAFYMLVPMRMELEGLSAQETVDAVLRENLHGLEIDQRCVEIAAFALAMAAWRLPEAERYRVLPELNLACSGLSLNMSKEQWTALAPPQSKLRNALDLLYDEFQMAPVLGSLLDPGKGVAANLVDFQELLPIVEKLLSQEKSEEEHEAAVVAHGLAKTNYLLSQKYSWVITNVPYRKRADHCDILRVFCENNYSTSKYELATVFLERCLQIINKDGTCSIVLPQNWLFLKSYEELREKLLKNKNFHCLSNLGPGAFEEISGEVVKAILLSVSKLSEDKCLGNEVQRIDETFGNSMLDNSIMCLDVSAFNNPAGKSIKLIEKNIINIKQDSQLKNPDKRILFSKLEKTKNYLSKYADSFQGLMFKDRIRVIKYFWEVFDLLRYSWMQSSFKQNQFFTGKKLVINCIEFEINYNFLGGNYKWNSSWGFKGVGVCQMGSLPRTCFLGDKFDGNIDVVIPKNEKMLPEIFCYISDESYINNLRELDSKLDVNTASLVQVPFDLEYWTSIAQEKYPYGLPLPFSDDPTQWIFHGHPCGSVIWDDETKWTAHGPLRSDETVLHVAVARLLGYRWPGEQDPDMELADEVREWSNACQELVPLADEDGIVCIPSVHGEARASERLLHVLGKAYGKAWSPSMLSKLLTAVGCSGKDLDHWLREKFFEQHCKIFHHRPFIWHIWDGLKDGFSVLVNYHQLDRHNLERLIYTYLGDWIRSQQRAQAEGVDGADERVAASAGLKRRLEAILHGEKPLDIFVRWKPLEEQPIGWEPDVNDGVRLNIRPFVYVDDVKHKNAGVLRKKPSIKWSKDRGKDVESAPWYHLFQGERINDHHLSLAEKKEAREKAENNARRQS